MNTMQALNPDVSIDRLLEHIHHKTFGRLHELNVVQKSDGRLHISATAHSRFIGQLTEWAVWERLVPADVDLTITVLRASPYFLKVPK